MLGNAEVVKTALLLVTALAYLSVQSTPVKLLSTPVVGSSPEEQTLKKDKLVQMSAKIAEYQRRSLSCVYKRIWALPKVFLSLGRLGRISALLESTCCAWQPVSKGHGVIYPPCLNHGIKGDIWIQGQSGLPLATVTRPVLLLLC